MGCNASIEQPPNFTKARLLIVSEETVRSPSTKPKTPGETYTKTKLDLYSLEKIEFLGTLPLPQNPYGKSQTLTRGFSIAIHPTKPQIYLTGGVYMEVDNTQVSSHIYEIELRGKCKAWKFAQLPSKLETITTCISCHDSNEFLYVFGDSSKSYRLNISTGNWEEIPFPPDLDIGNLESIHVIHDKVIMISDGRLWKYSPEYPGDGYWEVLIDTGYPSGFHTVVGDKIYNYSTQTDKLSCWDMQSGKINLYDVDTDSLKASMGMVGIGYNYIYFTGCPYSDQQLTVLEYDLMKKRAVVSGYLKLYLPEHKAHIVLQEIENN